jgi:endonuclease/exonuclease/phosphatase family metal-dependent hydrolase
MMNYNGCMIKIKYTTFLLLFISLYSAAGLAQSMHENNQGFRILSWNVSEDAFVENKPEFRALVKFNQPDILLLDEVSPGATEMLLREALPAIDAGSDQTWFIDFGHSGGRQRGVVVSRYPLETVPEFDKQLPYPPADLAYITEHMTEKERTYENWSTTGGIAANAAIANLDSRRLLLVTLDMQCCGNDPASWQEYRRRVEATEIRRLVRQVLDRTKVDAVIVAGDFNLVATPVPIVIMSNPDRPPFSTLATAEIYQIDGKSSWTWDGRGSQWPSRVMDFQLYSAQTIKLTSGFVFNSELLSTDDLEKLNFQPTTQKSLSDHLPLVVDYRWH